MAMGQTITLCAKTSTVSVSGGTVFGDASSRRSLALPGDGDDEFLVLLMWPVFGTEGEEALPGPNPAKVGG